MNTTRVIAHLGRSASLYLGVAILLIFSLFPFVWMGVTSLKTNAELYDIESNPFTVRRGITLSHYTYLFTKTLYPRWYANTLLVASLSTIIAVCVSVLAAYALARLRFRGADTLGIGIFAIYLVPTSLLFLPLSRVVVRLGLNDTLWALVVTYPTFLIPFATWLLISYFRTIPHELEECAMVDGASRLRALVQIVLPVALPGLVTVTIFSFTLSWGELMYALTFVSSSVQKTLSVGTVGELVRGDVFYWGELMAGGLLAAVPVGVLYAFLSEYYVAGLAAGAIK
jgi:multiple sugar transport system permease protein